MKFTYFLISAVLITAFLGCGKDPQTPTNVEAKVNAINCDSAKINGGLALTSNSITQGISVSNIPLSINYQGGNGGTFSDISINSTGITGLTATAKSGNVANGDGALELLINGTAANAGIANFAISLGGQTCTIQVKVNSNIVSAVISSLNCGGAATSGTATSGTPVSNLTLTIPYIAGNGGSYSAISITSTGVTGLTATANNGNVSNGNGNLILAVNGTPNTDGNANFNVSLGGQSCNVIIPVQKPTVKATMVSGSFTSTSSGNFGYWLYTPKNPTANMPLIVYFHGGSFRGTDINLLIGGSLPKFLSDSTVKDIPAYILMPQCPTGKTWEQITTPIIELIDNIVSAKSININKISLTGHSLGGTGTWKYGATYSSKFSAIAPLSGSVVVSTASQYKDIPVYAFVGSSDVTVDPQTSIDIVPAINSAGGTAQIKNYSGATHFDVPDLTYKDNAVNILNWLILQNK